MSNDDIYVVVAERDGPESWRESGGPLVLETYLDSSSLDDARRITDGLGLRFGRCRIAKLDFMIEDTKKDQTSQRIDSANQFWIVWNPDNNLTPTVRHPTKQKAVDEAKRLATKFTGSTFIVMASVSSFFSGGVVERDLSNTILSVQSDNHDSVKF